MNQEFISRSNAIVLELERRGQNATADAMRAVITDYENSQKRNEETRMTNCKLVATPST
ncbi:MAG: hypothetical protein ABJR23_15270 [Paracoccaceae bacterium]